jgi:hypothetical protein
VSGLKNKHTLVAVLIAPVLTLIAWYSVDLLVGEKPKPAVAGQSYELVEKPGCRWASGGCELQNGDFELEITPEWSDGGRLALNLESVFPLDGVKLAQVKSETEEGPMMEMDPASEDGRSWTVELTAVDPRYDRLRLVAAANQVLYYGDVALKFAQSQQQGD